METIVNVLSIALLVFGFGFVVFWHELGHFLAAKAVGIKVEQFAVGMGRALLCWRKGVGVTVGTSAPVFEAKVRAEWEKRNQEVGATGEIEFRKGEAGPDGAAVKRIAEELGLGETEYRLNWLPLGGYVKMLGQDDMDPNAVSSDARAYNNKSVPARMLVVVAGVIMNIILAAGLFMGLFLWGFKVGPAIVGTVVAGSPAQVAGMKVGDRILEIGGDEVSDFNKIALHVALSEEGKTMPVKVLREGKVVELSVTPRKPTGAKDEFMAMGVGPAPALRAVPVGTVMTDALKPELQLPAEVFAMKPGDVIVGIGGEAITPEEVGKDEQTPSSWAKVDAAVQASDGKPVKLSVRGADGVVREIAVMPRIDSGFGATEISVGGVLPRPVVGSIKNGSSAVEKLLPGDVVLSVEYEDSHSLIRVGTVKEMMTALGNAGKQGLKVTMVVERGGKKVDVTGLEPNITVAKDRKGLGIGLDVDASSGWVGGVMKGSVAERAGLMSGARIVNVGGMPVGTLLDFRKGLLAAGGNETEVVSEKDGVVTAKKVKMEAGELAELAGMRFAVALPLVERIEPRRTGNPAVALVWGVRETRDVLLQGYMTILRMAQGSVSASNLTGPVGIFHAGGKIATNKTGDWTVWFLAIISANLAVVNFLPLPIVDGGLFVFLLLEKIRGRPLSAKAQGICQLAGLALILSVFLFVTYNDIIRLVS